MTETATFGAGCFWGVEWVFRKVPGVLDAVSGYSGGTDREPDLPRGVQPHDRPRRGGAGDLRPAIVTYDQLLQVFWAMHDPTQVDRQGPDVGDQYRSVIFTHTPEQRGRDRARSAQGTGERFSRPIATEIETFAAFYPAEDYHQRYYEGNGHTPYCHVFPTDVVEKLGLGQPA